jgi:hypothetical protein
MVIDTVTPHITDREHLYEHFKETNWWARHPNAWKWVSVGYGLILLVLMFALKKGAVSFEITVGATLGFLPFLALLAVIKHFVHDRAREEYFAQWKIH